MLNVRESIGGKHHIHFGIAHGVGACQFDILAIPSWGCELTYGTIPISAYFVNNQ